MSRIEIRKFEEGTMENLFRKIKERAYSLFETRGQSEGKDIEDWLAAERELIWSPPAELTETGDEFHLRVAVPGFDEKEIEVTATPDTIFVKAEASSERKKEDEGTLFTEFGQRTLFRRVDLPSPADLDRATATLSKGVLTVTAAKQAAPEGKKGPEPVKKIAVAA